MIVLVGSTNNTDSSSRRETSATRLVKAAVSMVLLKPVHHLLDKLRSRRNGMLEIWWSILVLSEYMLFISGLICLLRLLFLG